MPLLMQSSKILVLVIYYSGQVQPLHVSDQKPTFTSNGTEVQYTFLNQSEIYPPPPKGR